MRRATPAVSHMRRDPCGQISGCPRAPRARIFSCNLFRSRASSPTSATTSAARSSRRRAQMEEEGQQDHQAQHRQHRRVRLRAARRDRAGHDPQPAATRPATPTRKGLFAPRKAIVHYTQQKHIKGVTVDDVYLGNGASELITMSMNALLNNGDEVLMPGARLSALDRRRSRSPAARRCTTCATKRPAGCPTSTTSRRKITPRTKRHRRHQSRTTRPARCIRIELLQQIVELAREHQPDRLRRRDLRQDALRRPRRTPRIASLADDVLFLTFNGLSKNYRSCGYRAGWMVVSGDKKPRQRLHRGPEHARVDAPVRQHAGPARDPDRARRLPEHQRPGRRRAGACAASATWPTSCSPRSRA